MSIRLGMSMMRSILEKSFRSRPELKEASIQSSPSGRKCARRRFNRLLDLDTRESPSGPLSDSLDLNLSARSLDLSLDLRGLILRDAFLDRLRCALDQVLGLFETETRNGADFLDDLDLLVAGRDEDDVEFRLLLRGSRCGPAARRSCDGDRGRSGSDSPLRLHALDQRRDLHRLELGDLRQNLFD